MRYIYRQRRGENSRPRCVNRGETLRGKGRRTILCGLCCTYTEDSPTPSTGLNLIQHNTSNSTTKIFYRSQQFSIILGSGSLGFFSIRTHKSLAYKKTRLARSKTAPRHYIKKKTFSCRLRKPPNPSPTLTQGPHIPL
jgi:hypothetical protein